LLKGQVQPHRPGIALPSQGRFQAAEVYLEAVALRRPSLAMAFSVQHDDARVKFRTRMQQGQFKPLKTKMCSFFKVGRCRRAGDCRFAHDEAELSAPPDLTKTSICIGWETGTCKHSIADCRFAHGKRDLRVSAPIRQMQEDGFVPGVSHSGKGMLPREYQTGGSVPFEPMKVRLPGDLFREAEAMLPADLYAQWDAWEGDMVTEGETVTGGETDHTRESSDGGGSYSSAPYRDRASALQFQHAQEALSRVEECVAIDGPERDTHPGSRGSVGVGLAPAVSHVPISKFFSGLSSSRYTCDSAMARPERRPSSHHEF